jgi:hypothetical protein
MAWMTLLLGALTGFSAAGPWDDAYMFTRYADNLIRDGTLSWNPGGEPSYGLTSLLHLAVVTPLRVLGGSPAIALVMASGLMAVAFIVLLTILLARRVTEDRAVAHGLLVAVFGLMAMSAYRFAPHIVSGMDTTLALTFTTGLVLLLDQHERVASRGSAVALGLYGGLSMWVRPDLLVFGVGVPTLLAAGAGNGPVRRRWALAAGLAVAGTALALGIAWRWLGSPVPLGFHAKSRAVYGAAFQEHYWLESLVQLGHYLESYWVLWAMLVGVWALDARGWWRRSAPSEKALTVAMLVFIGYHATQVTPIMGWHQRFYYPTLPVLAFVAGRAAAGWLPAREDRQEVANASRPRRGPWRHLASALMILAAVALVPTATVLGVRVAQEIRGGRFARFDMIEHYRANWQRLWFALDAVSTLPDDLILATTEVGLPAALNPRKTIIDLAGLNHPEIARRGFSAANLVAQYRPDLVYLPHWHYREMIQQLLGDPRFVADYDYRSPEALDAWMGVAVRRSGRHAGALQGLLDRNGPTRAAGSGRR